MKKRNKILALLLAMTMCGTAFAGCGSDTKPSEFTEAVSTETVAGTETTATEPVAEGPLKNADIYPLDSDKTFTVVTSAAPTLEQKDSTVITKLMEETTGVSIDWSYMTKDQLALAITSKEIPDAMFLAAAVQDKTTIYEYGKAGFYVNFMDYLDIMPNLAAIFEANPDALEVVQNEDGSVYTLPKHVVSNTGYNNLIYYRTDMMKEIGWEKQPATTDEFIQYCKDLQAHYGATDKEFIAFNGYQANYMNWGGSRFVQYFFPAFGELLVTGISVDSKDNIAFGAATEQYKHYLEFMNELWNSGAFNTNIYTQEAAASQALAAGNHVGIAGNHNGHAAANFASGKLEMDVMAPLTSEYWDTQHWYQSPAWAISYSMISTKCEDIETMCKWFDALYAPADDPLNEEGTIWGAMTFLGEIGVDVELDDTTMVYTVKEHEGFETATFLAQEGFSQSLYNGYEGGFPYTQDVNTNVGMKGAGTVKNLWPYAETPIIASNLTLTQDESDVYNDAWADINAYITEMTAKFITGELNIEAEWATYLGQLDKMDLPEVLKVYTAAYERYKAK